LLLNQPTAVQNDTDTHETEFKELEPEPVLGLVTRVHDVPFQLNTNVRFAEPL